MASVARSGDTVLSPDGSGYQCGSPMQTSVGEVNNKNVTANGSLIVVAGNLITPHPKGGCSNDDSTLSSYSSTVTIGGKGVGRIGDTYGNNVITQGSPSVFAG